MILLQQFERRPATIPGLRLFLQRIGHKLPCEIAIGQRPDGGPEGLIRFPQEREGNTSVVVVEGTKYRVRYDELEMSEWASPGESLLTADSVHKVVLEDPTAVALRISFTHRLVSEYRSEFLEEVVPTNELETSMLIAPPIHGIPLEVRAIPVYACDDEDRDVGFGPDSIPASFSLDTVVPTVFYAEGAMDLRVQAGSTRRGFTPYAGCVIGVEPRTRVHIDASGNGVIFQVSFY